VARSGGAMGEKRWRRMGENAWCAMGKNIWCTHVRDLTAMSPRTASRHAVLLGDSGAAISGPLSRPDAALCGADAGV